MENENGICIASSHSDVLQVGAWLFGCVADTLVYSASFQLLAAIGTFFLDDSMIALLALQFALIPHL